MEGMSNRQKDVYDFIKKYHAEHGISPAILDIAAGLSLANSTVATYVNSLLLKGYVTNMTGIPRSLKIVPTEAIATN